MGGSFAVKDRTCPLRLQGPRANVTSCAADQRLEPQPMTRISAPLFAALLMAPLTALAQDPQTDLPPGLTQARLLPGWTDEQGHRIAALELVLQPGWKTYWRSPGDSGIPPRFDWDGSTNLGEVSFQWPAPELIDSDGTKSFGFHDRLVLPFEVTPLDPDQPVDLTAHVEFGICEKICVPASLTLSAPEVGNRPDPVIQTALANQPASRDEQPACRLTAIEDGMQVQLDLMAEGPVDGVAVELPSLPDVWVSAADLAPLGDNGLTATADFVPPQAAPFDLDPQAVLITVIQPDAVWQMQGCVAEG